MKNPIDAFLDNVPTFVPIFVDKCLSLSRLIKEKLENHNEINTQRKLAVSLDKTEAEISKYLSGQHNFTFRTVSKIEAALGESLFVVLNKKNKEKIVREYLQANGLKTVKKSSYHISEQYQSTSINNVLDTRFSVYAPWGNSFKPDTDTPSEFIENSEIQS